MIRVGGGCRDIGRVGVMAEFKAGEIKPERP
jgi:hypothetical protein